MRDSIIILGLLLCAPQPDSVQACEGAPCAVDAGEPGTQSHRAPAAFDLKTPFWVNLHHFLYVLGRAANGEADATRGAVAGAPADLAGFDRLSAERQEIWNAAVQAYQVRWSRMDAIFDDSLTRATALLSRATDDAAIETIGLDTALVRTLRQAEPVYRDIWWERHRNACQRRTEEMRGLLEEHGQRIGDRIAVAYGESWPESPMPVSMTAWANWAGAYSTNRHGGLIAFSCLSEGNTGTSGLEILFHEAMHWWDDAMARRLRRIAANAGASVPSDLTHAMIFHTAGHSVSREVPGHVPYAEQAGIWRRGMGRYKAVLDTHWLPWLEGNTTSDAALAALLRQLAGVP